MKHNWEYKRLGSLFRTTSGGTPLKGVSEYYDGGTIPWLRSGEVCKKDIYNCEVFITDKAVNESSAKFVPVNSVVMAMYGATAAQVGILRKSMTTNQAVCSILPSSNYLPDFLYYYLSSLNVKLVGKAYGAAQPNISQTIIKDIKVPILTHKVQEQIVAELDKINELIEQNRELLRQLDSLAQSLFYDTFGDPVTNPKGWDFVQLDNISELKAGKAIKASELSQESVPSSYPCFGGNGLRGYTNEFSHEGTYCIIGRQGALCGNIKIAKGKFYATEHAVVAKPLMKYTTEWFFYTLEAINLNQYATGVAQPGLSVNVINKITIPVPPLSLQQQFAAKIEAIEAQKATIEKSIAELQTLLDSRMDYWFN